MCELVATEVNVARGRLKGALQEIVNVGEDEDDLDASKPSRGRPPKRVKKESSPPPQPTIQHTFIMKLFDRCVDLAKYHENAPLYPICRAWMLNQPRSSLIVKYVNMAECITLIRPPHPHTHTHHAHVKHVQLLTVTKLERSRSSWSESEMTIYWKTLKKSESAMWPNCRQAQTSTYHEYHLRCHSKRTPTASLT